MPPKENPSILLYHQIWK